MKYSITITCLLCILFTSCDWSKVDPTKAKDVAENLMKDMQSGDYSRLDSYYTASFNESEPLDAKTAKFRKLREALGDVQSWQLVSSQEDNTIDYGGPKLQLRYTLKCARATVTHTLVIINDEGQHKIAFQNFENTN